MHSRIVGKTICNNAPRESVSAQLASTFGKVGTDKRFSAGNDNKHRVSRIAFLQRQNRLQKILERHIPQCRRSSTIRTAVTAIQVATLSTFPEKVVEFVKLGFLPAEIVVKCLKHRLFCSKRDVNVGKVGIN